MTSPDEQGCADEGATLIGSCSNPDGSVTYHYEFTPGQASGLGFEVGGFVITGYPDVPEQDR